MKDYLWDVKLSTFIHFYHQLTLCLNIFHYIYVFVIWYCQAFLNVVLKIILFPKLTSSAQSLIFNINDGILRILIDHAASRLGKYQHRLRQEQLTAEKKINCSFYREELTVDPAFAKMSGDPSICTEGTAKMFNFILWFIQGLLVCTATYISGYVYLGIWGFHTICEFSPHWIYLFLCALSNYSFSAPVRNFEEIQH